MMPPDARDRYVEVVLRRAPLRIEALRTISTSLMSGRVRRARKALEILIWHEEKVFHEGEALLLAQIERGNQ
jgi:hypothetical protein